MATKEPITKFIQSVGQLPEADQDLILRTLRLLQNAPPPAQECARLMLRERVLVGAADKRHVRAALEDILAYLSVHQPRDESSAYAGVSTGSNRLM
jgi:hypothetical protein